MPATTLAKDNLRPSALNSFIGQSKTKKALSIAIDGANAREEPCAHTLLVGPPGLGKTTLAFIIAEETKRQLITASGTSLTKIPSLATILNQLPQNGGVVFIDEIHRLPNVVAEALYSVMEDYRLDVTTEKMHINMHLPKFTLVGATTRQGLITKPMRDRFVENYHLEFYSMPELIEIIKRSAAILKLDIEDKAAEGIAQRCKRTPRIANNLLLQSRNFALSYHIAQVSFPVVLGMMEVLEIDELGLTRTDRTILETIIDKFHGGPVGLDTLAATMVEESDVLERVHEPYLMQEALLERTARGRVVTRAAYKHLQRPLPATGPFAPNPYDRDF